MNTGTLVKWEALPIEDTTEDAAAKFRRFLCQPGAVEFLIRCMDQYPQLHNRCIQLDTRCHQLEQHCIQLRQQCEAFEMLCRTYMCPGTVNYSQRTLDGFSDKGKVLLNQIVQDVGPDFVNSYPVPPGKSIRLTHRARPGYLPGKIGVDLNIAGGGSNYLDFELQFFLVPGGFSDGVGVAIGEMMTANEFLDKDGSQKLRDFFQWQGYPMDIGALEYVAVTIKNTGGANNLDSAQVNLYYDNKLFYELCKRRCGCAPTTAAGSCPTG